MKKQEDKKVKISPSVEKNFSYIKDLFGSGIGLATSENLLFKTRMRIGLIFIDSVTDKEMLRIHVLAPLLKLGDVQEKHPEKALLCIQSSVISVVNTSIAAGMDEIAEKLIKGYAALFVEKSKNALLIECLKLEKRSIETPENETAVLGSQESFTDNLSTNISLILKRLPDKNLRFEEFTIGRLSHTDVRLVWLEGVANPIVLEEARKRIRAVETDNLGGLGVLSELIEDKPLSLFPKYRQTERPDSAAMALSKGCFCILCNNSPFAFLAPTSLWDNFKTMDDYEERFSTASYLRIVRYVAFMISILISPLYLAFVTYNQPIVPPGLALSIAAGREGVPLPTVMELLLLTFAISIIREAGLRMSGSTGYFIGTLAAVLIGQAIVMAGYVSPSLIIVVAISTIASFAISATTLLYTSRLVNYFLILLAGFFGIFGVINGLIILYWHLASMYSFGVPFLYPVVPFDRNGIKDVFIRFPMKTQKDRMARLSPESRQRTGGNVQGKSKGKAGRK
jgi:spore germination protein KA